jgi:arginyl-tRNA synthetase
MRHTDIEKEITSLVERAVLAVFAARSLAKPQAGSLQIALEIPKDTSHGDISTNIAMKLCSILKSPPMELAGAIAGNILNEISSSKGLIGQVDVKNPGFINFFLSREYLMKALTDVKRLGDNYGRSAVGGGARLQVEFVSANPTGPLTIAHGRQAAIGDSLANILEFAGYRVTREYYLNDEGTQMNILGASIKARYRGLLGAREDFPEDGYKGAYIYDIAKDFRARYGDRFANKDDIEPFREFGMKWLLKDIRSDLKEFGVKFDVWYSQKKLGSSGKVGRALELLKKKGYLFEKEGATWFRSTDFGDDKDRVVIKSDGSKTYLAPDIAYHLEKYHRGFKRIIDLWGPDHHGYVPRMKAAIQALGFSKDSLDVLIVQLATLYRGGAVVSMSTRAGEFITLREVRGEVGKDVARFCFIMRRLSSHLDFDLDVVKKESMDNPVYYIQYAHARIWSILDKGRSAPKSASFDPKLLVQPEETALLRALSQFPTAVALGAKTLEPYTILQYLEDLAGSFHSFYNKHRVVGDDPRLTRARLVLVDGVRIVLANGLRLLGVSLPKKM